SEKGNLQLVEKNTGALKNTVSRGFPEAFLESLDHIHAGGAACGEARNESRRVLVEDVASSPIFSGTASLEVLLQAGVRSVQSTPLVSRSGRVLGVLSTSSRKTGRPDEGALRLLDSLVREIADLVERNESEQALREADRRKDDFLAILAHELRNPLAPLRNGLEILRTVRASDPTTEEIHEMMERQVKHLIRMVDDLMEVSRITRGRIELHREPVELSSIFQSALETAKPLIQAGRHELSTSLPPEPFTLRADPVRLTQVLANLLNNAAKYTSERGAIHLSARRVGGDVEISVRDNGAGIGPEALPRIFDLFTQADYSLGRTQGGLGIGLSLVRSLVEMHGGGVEARSEGPGRGSEFLVRLPVDNTIEAGTNGARASEETSLRGSFLVVDDNHDSADMIALLLSSLGAKVRVVYDGRSALEAIRGQRPEVALVDLGMPGLDGLEVARRIREETELRDVVLVAMTGWGQEEDRRRSREAGFDHHLVKPVTVEALQGLLSSREAGASVREY
ncbi:MAG: hybrid sensor histidine kinase/response regulator, partial [Vicinamibacteria bacterium]